MRRRIVDPNILEDINDIEESSKDTPRLRNSLAENEIISETNELSREEAIFCELYVNGDNNYAGKPKNCYIAAFAEAHDNHFDTTPTILGKKLLKVPRISKRISELMEEVDKDLEARALKRQMTETLQKIIEETSTAIYLGKNGKPASPAPLRSVAVSAIKTMTELHPIKAKQTDDVEEKKDTGITFNVIVPQATKPEDSKGITPEQSI